MNVRNRREGSVGRSPARVHHGRRLPPTHDRSGTAVHIQRRKALDGRRLRREPACAPARANLRAHARPPAWIIVKMKLAYLERWRIFLLRRMRRRVLFFFHFHRILAVAFFQGLDLCPMVGVCRGGRARGKECVRRLACEPVSAIGARVCRLWQGCARRDARARGLGAHREFVRARFLKGSRASGLPPTPESMAADLRAQWTEAQRTRLL